MIYRNIKIYCQATCTKKRNKKHIDQFNTLLQLSASKYNNFGSSEQHLRPENATIMPNVI